MNRNSSIAIIASQPRLGSPTPESHILLSFSWTFMGRVVYCACQWAMLITVARLLGVVAVGQWGLALAIATPVFAFLDFKLRWVIATDTEDNYNLGDYLALRVCTMLAGVLAVVAIVALSQVETHTAFVICVYSLVKGVEHLSEALFGVLQKYDRLDLVGRSLMIRGVATLVSVTVAVIVTGSLIWAFVMMGAVWTAVLFFYDSNNAARSVPESRRLRVLFDGDVLSRLLRGILTLGAVALVVSLGRAIPRYFLASHHGEAAVGLFTVIAYFHLVGDVVVTSLAHSAITRLAARLKKDEVLFRRLLIRLILFGAAVGGVFVGCAHLLGAPLLELVYGHEYRQCALPLTWLMVGSTAAYMNAFVGAALVTIRKPGCWAVASCAGAAACFLVSLTQIPQFGVLGASWAFTTGCWTSLLFGASLLASTRSIPRRGFSPKAI